MKGRLEAGDPIRALSAGAAVFVHCVIASLFADEATPEEVVDAFGPFQDVFFSLQFVTYMFFGLSAYLLGRPFARWVLFRGRRPDIRRYARHRFARILPAYWIIFGLTLIFLGTGGSGVLDLLRVALLLNGWDNTEFGATEMRHGWTLDAEALFYFLLPLGAIGAAALVARRRQTPEQRARWLIGGIALVSLISLSIETAADTVEGYQRPPAALYSFAPGLILATLEPLLAERAPGSDWARKVRVGALWLAGVSYLIFFSTFDNLGPSRSLPGLGIAAGCLAYVIVRQWCGDAAPRTLDRKPLHWVGERSYGLYLVHLMMLQLLDDVYLAAPNEWVSLVIAFSLVFPAALLYAHLSWTFVEKPALRRADSPWRKTPIPGEQVQAAP